MWELINDMMTDRLWIATAIVGSIFGALFVTYMKDTRVALWTYGLWDSFLDAIRDKFGWTWFDQDPNAWTKWNPNLFKKISELESRIKDLEKTIEKSNSN